jgi:multiple sugar transport system substrate-binding protein
VRRLRSAFLIASVALISVLGGCSSGGTTNSSTKVIPPAHGKVTLDFWSWVPGIDKAVTLWNRTHPNIQVNVGPVPSNGGYPKMFAALQAHKAPCLAQVEYYEIPAFVLNNGLIDISKYGANAAQKTFTPWQWQQGIYAGHLWSIPQASGPMGLFYRKDIFSKLGLGAPKTWAEFAKDAAIIHKANPKMYISSFSPSGASWFTGLAWQAGAHWYGTGNDIWHVNMTDPATQKVASLWQGMLDKNLVTPLADDTNAWYKDIQDGNIVTEVGAQWDDALLIGNAPKTSGKWAVAPLPQWTAGADTSANFGGSSTAVLNGCNHPSEAVKFAVWLNSNPQSIAQLVQGGYGWPATPQGTKSPQLNKPSKFFGGQVYNDVFADADRHIDTTWKWIPTTSNCQDHVNDGLESAVNGHATIISALRKAQTECRQDLKQEDLPVAE